MDIMTILGFLGAVFSILSFFIPTEWKSNSIVNIMFVLIIVIFCCVILYQNSKLKRITQISKYAEQLIKKRYASYGRKGYIQAVITFCEQFKDLYPNSFERAMNIFNEYIKIKDTINYEELEDVCNQLDGIIDGIAIFNSEK
ncbi:MAG: hypothetical protein LBN95_08060 [Prevotellaceae bacterium]|jgi:flagellar motor component MotA|nr:hypothetical protein [Prevotellaceae bacterium]